MGQSYVYIFGRLQGPVKVGVSDAPWRRILSVQTGSHFPLEILFVHPLDDRAHALKIEREFCDKFSDRCETGEWFRMTQEDAIFELRKCIIYDLHDGMIEIFAGARVSIR